MKILRYIKLSFERWHNAWALKEIDPLHPDVNGLVVKQVLLQDQLRKLFA